MDNFINGSPSEQRLYFEQAQAKLGLPPESIEKDFWVCWTLWKLFKLPRWGEHLTFKGGIQVSNPTVGWMKQSVLSNQLWEANQKRTIIPSSSLLTLGSLERLYVQALQQSYSR